MKEPVAVTIYETSDGRNFPTLEQVKLHEESIEVTRECVAEEWAADNYTVELICKWFLERYDLIPRVTLSDIPPAS